MKIVITCKKDNYDERACKVKKYSAKTTCYYEEIIKMICSELRKAEIRKTKIESRNKMTKKKQKSERLK